MLSCGHEINFLIILHFQFIRSRLTHTHQLIFFMNEIGALNIKRQKKNSKPIIDEQFFFCVLHFTHMAA